DTCSELPGPQREHEVVDVPRRRSDGRRIRPGRGDRRPPRPLSRGGMMGEFITRYEGRCWKFGSNIPTDALVKSQYVFEPMEEIVRHVLEDQNPRFPREVQPGDIVVAGFHFGQSSGRAIAAKALQATGIGCVVSD